MLDKRTLRLLNNLAQICADGSYKIIETADLVKVMSPKYKLNAESIEQIIKLLSDNEMIDKKYSDENKYCLAVLPKGRVFAETQGNRNMNALLSRRLVFWAVSGSFIAAFIGTLLANFLSRFLG